MDSDDRDADNAETDAVPDVVVNMAFSMLQHAPRASRGRPSLVVDAGPCRISQSQPCAAGAKYGGRLLKIEDTRVVELASDRGA